MLQQAIKIDPDESSEDVIEDALQQIGPPIIRQISLSVKNAWPYWNNILLQLNPKGFPMIKSSEEITQAIKDTTDVLTKSSATLTESCDEMNRQIMQITHKTIAAHLTTGKEMLDVKTPGDWLALHSKWSGNCFNIAFSHMSELSKLSAKLINQTYEPVKSQFNTTFTKLGGCI